MSQKRIISLVTNDLEGDQRVHKTALTLAKAGYHIRVLGRLLPESKSLLRPYSVKRIRMIFTKGPWFYACLNFRFFIYLLIKRYDLILANDLDTLLCGYLASRIRKKALVFDSHEFFTQVPELIERPRVQSIWKRIEGRIVPKLNHMMTVNEEIASLFEQTYGMLPQVVMNLPMANHQESQNIRTIGKIKGPIRILYQGAVNKGRGLEEMVNAMSLLTDHELHIVGGGDRLEALRLQVSKLEWRNRIHLHGRYPLDQLKKFVKQADLGISLEKDLGLNYRLALPNKLFDYMQGGLPVVCSNLPVMARLVKEVDYGIVIDNHEPNEIASAIQQITIDPQQYSTWSRHAIAASSNYAWEQQEASLLAVFDNALNVRR